MKKNMCFIRAVMCINSITITVNSWLLDVMPALTWGFLRLSWPCCSGRPQGWQQLGWRSWQGDYTPHLPWPGWCSAAPGVGKGWDREKEWENRWKMIQTTISLSAFEEIIVLLSSKLKLKCELNSLRTNQCLFFKQICSCRATFCTS